MIYTKTRLSFGTERTFAEVRLQPTAHSVQVGNSTIADNFTVNHCNG